MSKANLLNILGNSSEVPYNWMPATGIRSLMQGDPCLLWLQFHGKASGFKQDSEEFSFLGFIGEKGRGFEAAWARENCPGAPRMIEQDWDVRQAENVEALIQAMENRLPIIWKCPLWNAPSQIYGTADFLALRSWVDWRFPGLLGPSGASDHYIAIELKFTTKLDTAEKADDLASYRNQLRLYSYMVGAIQGKMPQEALIITRDRLDFPIVLETGLNSDELPSDLVELRDWYQDIKLNGARYLPWRDKVVAPLIGADSSPWNDAKKIIAKERIEGGAMELLHQFSSARAKVLKQGGIHSLAQLINEPQHWPELAQISGIGKAARAQMIAILEANRTGLASRIPADVVLRASVEIYVDYEYFTSINVDFQDDWPELKGCEMIFAIGCGWEEDGQWQYREFIAESETHEAEEHMFVSFLGFLYERGVFSREAALYHWTNAEVWQSRKAAERTGIAQVGELPWVDLNAVFMKTPIGIPGCLQFGLKPVAKALAKYAPEFAIEWPDGLGDGLSAQVMSWAAYEAPDAKNTREMRLVGQYLEIDVKATWMIHRWLRSVAK